MSPSPLAISGHTRVFMVAGDPVSQVQAPAIFNRIFQRHGVDAVLVPAQVAPERFVDFARTIMAAGNIDGLWLTIPHKTTLLPLLGHVDTAGHMAQSVNAVRRHADGTLEGGLFDGSGLVSALRHFGLEPRGRRVLLLGTGGAGAAIATALLDQGVAELALHDLGPRAAQLAQRLGDARVSVPGADPAGFELIINATPLGLQADDALPVDVSRIDPGARVFDILMKHRPTPLLRACAERGIQAHPGFEMLVQQVPDYLRFFRMEAIADTVQADLSEVRRHLQAS
ncbi:shikimate dehydrogenase family protein [Sphaerotilus hippei]|uniref:shikimate dehydrogenase family protein n=1 Tax=Sphaerotilus hippei TaxID=744406 RepID=UPI001FED1919|nr:shikimate dehydrogenase [Sphaerotilus hippei]